MEIVIVMGTTASGKSHFIKKKFPDYRCFDILKYQNKMEEAEGNADMIGLSRYITMLQKANEQIIEDVVAAVKDNRDTNIVIEHTLFKAIRRITFINALRKVTDAPISIYVMMPSDERIKKNIICKGNMHEHAFEHIKEEMTVDIEFPNIAEGFAHIYKVRDDEIIEIKALADEKIIRQAMKELEEEAAKEKREKTEQYQKTINELENGKRFWHYCEVCGKKELLTTEEAYEAGWDYPPKMGTFRVLGLRKCGNCQMTDTLYWKLMAGEKYELTEKDKETIDRIKNEPFSLLDKRK